MPNKPHKNSLDIRLTESVVFLRAGDATGRHRIPTDAPPALLRGLLTLTLVKPTKISSIEVELLAKSSTAWPEGVGARRVEIAEEHRLYSQSYVFYRAGETPESLRRALSIGPGLTLDHEDDELSGESSEHGHADGRDQDTLPHRGRSSATARSPRVNRNFSVDQTVFRRDYVSHHSEQPPQTTPPFTPAYSHSPEVSLHRAPGSNVSISQRSPMGTVEESPAQSLEDFRRALRVGLDRSYSDIASPIRGRSPSRPQESANSSLRSPHDRSLSSRVSFDEDHRSEFQLGSSTDRPAHSPSVPSPTDERGRGRKRFSLASVSAALLDVVKDHVRSSSPRTGVDGDTTPPRGRTRDRSDVRDVSTARAPTIENELERDDSLRHKERSALGRVSEVLGLDDGKAFGEGWKEFKAGVYTYPISFAIPADSPPSLHCQFGSVVWKLKAYAHRPGTFTAKMSTAQEITVVATPGEDDTEDTESIIVERQWDSQMQYLIMISGRSFPIGGQIPIDITFMPWAKVKIHRVSVLIEERVDYYSNFKRIVRTDPITRLSLLSLKSPLKDGPPILPITDAHADAFKHSPLYSIMNPEDDIADVASAFMGPGPWRIQSSVELPNSCEELHFTNKNKLSNITISHLLKVIFRVERGDDEALDPQTGKRKMFDIVVQTPVHILSCLCNPTYTALPPYSRAAVNVSGNAPSCRCEHGLGRAGLPPGGGTVRLGVSPRRVDRMSSTQSARSAISPSESHGVSSLFVDPVSSQFERLISGQESDMGEAPPSYADAVTI